MAHENMERKSNPGRAVLGFFLTFITIILFFSSGIMFALKTSILRGKNIDNILKNSGFYSLVNDSVKGELYKQSQELGVSNDAIDEILSSDIIEKSASKMIDIISSQEDIDFSGIKDECISIAEKTSDMVVDAAFDTIKESGDSFDVSKLGQNETIKKFQKDYGLNVTEIIEKEVKDKTGSTVISTSSANMDELKAEVKDKVSTEVIPVISDTIDDYTDKLNDMAKEAANELNREYRISDLIGLVEASLSILTFATALVLGIAIALSALQILVYKNEKNRALRNIGISTMLPGIFMISIYIAIVTIFKEILKHITTTNNLEKAIKGFVEKNTNSICNRFLVIGIIYMVIFVVCTVLSIVLKKQYKQAQTQVSM